MRTLLDAAHGNAHPPSVYMEKAEGNDGMIKQLQSDYDQLVQSSKAKIAELEVEIPS